MHGTNAMPAAQAAAVRRKASRLSSRVSPHHGAVVVRRTSLANMRCALGGVTRRKRRGERKAASYARLETVAVTGGVDGDVKTR